MKHNSNNIKSIRRIGVMLLVLVLALVSSGTAAATPPEDPSGNTQESQDAVSSYLAAQNNPALSDEEKIKAAIDAYFTLRYEGQKHLEEQDFSPLVDDYSATWVERERDKRKIELYNATLFELNYVNYNYTLDYDSIAIENGNAMVHLRESHEVIFKAIAPEVSKLFNLKHTITLSQKQGRWVITQDEYQDDLSSLIDSNSVDAIMERLRSNFELETNQKGLEASNNDNPLFPDYVTQDGGELLTPSQQKSYHSYDRPAAVQYANAWVSNSEHLRNLIWGNFDDWGGDCTNYVSQIIFNGAPQMDDSGVYHWFYYGPDIEAGQRSSSWTGVTQLYDYLVHNNPSGIGPYGVEVANACALAPGDVIQIKFYNQEEEVWEWGHSVAVSYYAEDCYIIGAGNAILFDAHSDDHDNYPLSVTAQA